MKSGESGNVLLAVARRTDSGKGTIQSEYNASDSGDKEFVVSVDGEDENDAAFDVHGDLDSAADTRSLLPLSSSFPLDISLEVPSNPSQDSSKPSLVSLAPLSTFSSHTLDLESSVRIFSLSLSLDLSLLNSLSLS